MVTPEVQEAEETQALATEVDADQAKLDGEQGIVAPVPLTQAQIEVLLNAQASRYETQITGLTRMVSGLQGKIDSGLNAIRRDTTRSAAEQAQRLAQERFEQALAAVPEEQRPALRLIYQQQASPVPAQVEEPKPAAETPLPDASAAQWQEIFQVVEDMGLDPRSPGINYQVLQDPAKTERQRRQEFFKSVRDVQAKPSVTPAPAAAPTPRAPAKPATPSPPVQSGGQGAAGFRTRDDVLDAYIQGRITVEQKREAEARFPA